MRVDPARGQALRSVIIAASVLLMLGDARALTDEEIFRELRFNLTSPGPRALGMGGAFVAVADDATATQANPAGLTSLEAPEFFVEYGVTRADDQVFQSRSGSLNVDLQTGARNLPYLGLTSASSWEDASEVTFLGVAWPLRLGTVGRRLTLAGSRQVVLSGRKTLAAGSDVTESRFAYDSYPNTVRDGQIEAYSVQTPVSGQSTAKIVYWSASAGLEVHEDFSFGVTVTYATLDLEAGTETQVVDPLGLFLDPGHPRLPEQQSADVYQTLIDGTASSLAFAAGVYWHPDSIFAGGRSPWRFGAAYQRGARFSVSESTVLNGTVDTIFSNEIAVPDRLSVGATYRLGSGWLFAAEIERVEYSDLLEGFRSGVNVLTSQQITQGSFEIDPDKTVEFTIDDGYVPRVGVEYARALGARKNQRIAFRAGYFRTPDDRIRMVQFNSTDPDVNAVYLEAFPGGEPEDHVTAGVGYTFGRSSIQVAGGFGSRGSRIVGSYTYSMTRKRTGGGSAPAER